MISRSEEQTCDAGKDLAPGVELFSDSLGALVFASSLLQAESENDAPPGPGYFDLISR